MYDGDKDMATHQHVIRFLLEQQEFEIRDVAVDRQEVWAGDKHVAILEFTDQDLIVTPIDSDLIIVNSHVLQDGKKSIPLCHPFVGDMLMALLQR